MGSRARAILWAQWRTLLNRLPHASPTGLAFSVLIGVIWYGTYVALSVFSFLLLSNPEELSTTARILPGGLLLAFLYWQVMPLLLVSTGSALEMKKMLAYPIPKGELFGLEVLLRLSTGIEVVIVFLGAGLGLLWNPRIPAWAPFTLLVFAIFNLLVSAGIRDLLARLLARRIIRELLVFGFILAAALPQVLLLSQSTPRFRALAPLASSPWWPWVAAAQLAQGRFTLASASAVAGWTLAAYLFGRWQFEQGLRFDAQEQSARPERSARSRQWTDLLFRLPGRFFPDPLAAMVEKEFRSLVRSPRFRLVFIMGFSFGLLIWLPITFGRAGSPDSWMALNYLVMLSIYALLLLGDVLLSNIFGFDRSAAQLYFLSPVQMRTVLLAKNISALSFILLQVTLITLVCAILRFPVTPVKLFEAYSVTLVVTLFLMAAGNLTSVHNPKAVDPSKSLRNSAGRQTQAMLMLLFPVALFPVSLAYAARYAFESEWAFAGVLACSALFGLVLYRIATGSAVAAAEARKEAMIAALSGGDSPVGG